MILLSADIFLYGFGSAVTNLNSKEVERRAQEDRDKKSRKLLRIMRKPERYVNMVQFVVTLINVMAGAFYLNLWGDSMIAIVLSAVALLYIFLTFGVLLPKKIAVRIPERWAYASIGPVSVLITVLAPFTGFVSLSVKAILFLFGVREDEDSGDVTEEEIINIVQEGFEQGVIEDSEAEMISNILAYGDKEAQDIMTHRSNVVSIDGSIPLEDAIDFMLDGINSRYPVYEGNIDNIIGLLYLKDAIRSRRGGALGYSSIKDVPGLIREAHFVPQTKNIDELFEEMQSQKLQMVIVVDEYGQMDGLVTMEDILEEIVGNILDEYDEDTKYIEEKGKDEYIMEGKTPLEDLTERFGINFENEEFETLNGFMIYRLDHIPEPGEEFNVDYRGYNFKILSVENKMIQSVLVTKLPEEKTEDGEYTEEDSLEK